MLVYVEKKISPRTIFYTPFWRMKNGQITHVNTIIPRAPCNGGSANENVPNEMKDFWTVYVAFRISFTHFVAVIFGLFSEINRHGLKLRLSSEHSCNLS